MASFIFGSEVTASANGGIDYGADTFKVMLLTSTATPDKDLWLDRADVTNEVTGTGYTAGGNTIVPTVGAYDTVNDDVDITLTGTTWASSTITARYAVYYKSTGVAANDTLIACVDFGSDVSTTNGTFTLNDSTFTKNAPDGV